VRDHGVPDPRFTTNVDDLDELLSVVDVDNIDASRPC
jgi:hypothetical protein